MIVLSEQQVRELKNGAQQPIAVVNPESNEEFVLVRREVYDKLRALLDEEFNSEDGLRAQLESAAAAGWDDPALDIYNDLEPNKP